jgi:hypothetical protein
LQNKVPVIVRDGKRIKDVYTLWAQHFWNGRTSGDPKLTKSTADNSLKLTLFPGGGLRLRGQVTLSRFEIRQMSRLGHSKRLAAASLKVRAIGTSLAMARRASRPQQERARQLRGRGASCHVEAPLFAMPKSCAATTGACIARAEHHRDRLGRRRGCAGCLRHSVPSWLPCGP